MGPVKSIWNQPSMKLMFPKEVTQEQVFRDVFKPAMGARIEHSAKSTFKIIEKSTKYVSYRILEDQGSELETARLSRSS